MMRMSLTGSTNTKAVDEVTDVIDEIVHYEDSGFEINTESGSISISNSEGMGRLESRVMDSWRENYTTLVGDGSSMEVLQIPLQQINQNSNIVVLPDDRIQEIVTNENGDWYISGGAVSFQKQRSGEANFWQVPDGGVINDVTLLSDSLLIAHSKGLVQVFENKKTDQQCEHTCY